MNSPTNVIHSNRLSQKSRWMLYSILKNKEFKSETDGLFVRKGLEPTKLWSLETM